MNVGAGEPRRVRQPPRVGVEHRHDRQHRVGLGEPDGVRGVHRHRVQQRRAVRVHDTLRVAGGAARVAHRGGGAFVDVGPVEAGRLGAEEVLVAQHVGAGGRRLERAGVAAADDEVVLDRLQVGRDLGEQRHQAVVDDDDAVLAVVRDVGELLREQPDVQRVQHRAHARDREVRLEVRLVVPHERADPVAVADPEAAQPRRELLGPVRDLGERGALDRVAPERRDLAVAVHRPAVPEQEPDGQRVVLHRARQHVGPPVCVPSTSTTSPPARRSRARAPAGRRPAGCG